MKTQQEIQAAYRAKAIRRIVLDINRNTEPELLKKLESVPNINGYLKDLIRKEIRKDIERS